MRFALGNGRLSLQELDTVASTRTNSVWSKADDKLLPVPETTLINASITPWAVSDVKSEMQFLSKELRSSLEHCYDTHSQMTLPTKKDGLCKWRWHPWLGASLDPNE